MKKIRLLIADTDSSYLNALVRYLIGTGNQYEVTGYTDVARFVREGNDFTLGLLGKEFIDAVRKHPVKKQQFGRIMHLTDSIDEEKTDYEQIYKFQNMSTFIEQMRNAINIHCADSRLKSKENLAQNIRVIFSPMHHELALPFALSMAKIMGENTQTLFVDMEDISVLQQLLDRDMKRDLGDYLYHIAGQDVPDGNMVDFIGFYDTFYYMAPMKGLSALAQVTPEQWIGFIGNLRKSEFEQVIILMDSSVNGMDEILQAADDILLLGKPGEYYSYSMKVFAERMSLEGLADKCRQMLLPMSAAGQGVGQPAMGQMIGGNLGSFVRREFANAGAV
ncbi:MAG: hypothetical protein PUG04_07610 [Lachnospiraceae bacterium]|nr:hypothetical protein [Lachnospiraceae bacterium]